MVRVIKTIGKRAYYYDQHSKRVGGRVVTKSIYVGPVVPKRKRGGFLGGLTVPTFLVGAVLVGIKAARGELKTRTYRNRPVELLSLHRARQVAQKAIEGLDRKYAIDKTDTASFNASRARLPKEMQEEYQRAQMVAWKAVDAARQPALPTAKEMQRAGEMREFAERMGRARHAPAERHAAASVPIGEAVAEAPAPDKEGAELP